jgi:hypothetical protein
MPGSLPQPDYDKLSPQLDGVEIDQLMDWFCYTKPIGPSIRIVATFASGARPFSVVAAGNQLGPAVAALSATFPADGEPLLPVEMPIPLQPPPSPLLPGQPSARQKSRTNPRSNG